MLSKNFEQVILKLVSVIEFLNNNKKKSCKRNVENASAKKSHFTKYVTIYMTRARELTFRTARNAVRNMKLYCYPWREKELNPRAIRSSQGPGRNMISLFPYLLLREKSIFIKATFLALTKYKAKNCKM